MLMIDLSFRCDFFFYPLKHQQMISFFYDKFHFIYLLSYTIYFVKNKSLVVQIYISLVSLIRKFPKYAKILKFT